MLNIPRSALPTMHKSLRSPRHRSIPEWETKLCAAIGDGLVAKGVFDWSAASRGNLILTSEFELPGEIPVQFESRPSRQYWGSVDVSIVVNPHTSLISNERPGDIAPLLKSKGKWQGEATAMTSIYARECGPPGIALLYVSRWLQRKWRHVCDL